MSDFVDMSEEDEVELAMLVRELSVVVALSQSREFEVFQRWLFEHFEREARRATQRSVEDRAWQAGFAEGIHRAESLLGIERNRIEGRIATIRGKYGDQ